MKRELIINEIKKKLLVELTYEKICFINIDGYRNTVIELFSFINDYKDEYSLNSYDFREFLDKIYYELDLKKDWEENRFTLIIGELANYYTKEPYFWNTPFEEYKTKLNKLLSWETLN